MRITLLLAAMLLSSASFAKDSLHKGYVNKNGTYVAPHYQTEPDDNVYNNYSTKGNTNPYTGKKGTVDPLKAHSNNPYQLNDD